jgi:4-amino-4-deoxy-L-arabinose transferase-like glycosyltransferase
MMRRWWLALVILVLAATLRGLWLTADPPSDTWTAVGVVWHDEGAWTHNARNQALLGVWRTDAWNPIFIAPVFTALEYVSFETFGVGTWQARMVPVVSGLVAVLALMAGLAVVADRRAALIGGLLLATNYTWVTWNRAALMESTMTAFIVVSWAAYALTSSSSTRGRVWVWGVLAGIAAVAAFFTKAAAAFFIAALVLELATTWWLSRKPAISPSPHLPISSSAGLPILAGLCAATLVALAVLVVPYWTEFQFYNWEMTVTRKPVYTLQALLDRASWLPVVHHTFTRMWLVLVVASLAALVIVTRWRTAHPAERLAVLWLAVGLAELVVHDSGNERRYVMFVPALIALAAGQMSRMARTSGGFFEDSAVEKASRRLFPALLPVVAAVLAYLVAGSILRLLWLDDVLAGQLSTTVRVSATIAVLTGAAVWWFRHRFTAWLQVWRMSTAAVAGVVVITVGTDLTLYGVWAPTRTTHNYEASRMLGGLLPTGTLVHGKLANGLSLENQIAPIFVGRGFGNYADRLERDDARYILTYTAPEPGYEGEVILDVLQRYPQRRVILEFDVQETPGPDRAALIDKFPDGPDPRARDK